MRPYYNHFYSYFRSWCESDIWHLSQLYDWHLWSKDLDHYKPRYILILSVCCKNANTWCWLLTNLVLVYLLLLHHGVLYSIYSSNTVLSQSKIEGISFVNCSIPSRSTHARRGLCKSACTIISAEYLWSPITDTPRLSRGPPAVPVCSDTGRRHPLTGRGKEHQWWPRWWLV